MLILLILWIWHAIPTFELHDKFQNAWRLRPQLHQIMSGDKAHGTRNSQLGQARAIFYSLLSDYRGARYGWTGCLHELTESVSSGLLYLIQESRRTSSWCSGYLLCGRQPDQLQISCTDYSDVICLLSNIRIRISLELRKINFDNSEVLRNPRLGSAWDLDDRQIARIGIFYFLSVWWYLLFGCSSVFARTKILCHNFSSHTFISIMSA